MADLFISYTKSDGEWAFWLAAELRELGHRPHIHDWEINAGDDINAWMARALCRRIRAKRVQSA